MGMNTMFKFGFDALGPSWVVDTPKALTAALQQGIGEQIAQFGATYSRLRSGSLIPRIGTAPDGGTFEFRFRRRHHYAEERDRHRPAGRAPSDGSRFLELQRSFAAAVPKVVVGKLAGSSGTPRGFNDAMTKIRQQAAM
jgi:hypothetical protein